MSRVTDYFKFMNEAVLPFYEKGKRDFFLGRESLKVSYTYFQSEENDKVIFVSPGRTEFSMKYAETIYELKDLGYDFVLIDHRGQGFSECSLEDANKGHVDFFQFYVDDFRQLTEIIDSKKEYKKKVFLGHSMGSIIGILFAQEEPKYFDGMIAMSPMLKISLKGIPEKIGIVILFVMRMLGLRNSYVFNGGPYRTNIPFENNRVTSCLARYKFSLNLQNKYRSFIKGDPTFSWLWESLFAAKRAYKQAALLKMPFLMFQAGEDKIVKPSRQNRFIRKLSKGEMMVFPDAEHEIPQERNDIREKAISRIKIFLSRF